MAYLHRTSDIILEERLEAFGAVLIEGPKWCGKTTTAEQVAKSVIKLQDTDMRNEYLATAASKHPQRWGEDYSFGSIEALIVAPSSLQNHRVKSH